MRKVLSVVQFAYQLRDCRVQCTSAGRPLGITRWVNPPRADSRPQAGHRSLAVWRRSSPSALAHDRGRVAPLVLVVPTGEVVRVRNHACFHPNSIVSLTNSGFFVAYPDGLNQTWNDTRGLSVADDVGFIRALIAGFAEVLTRSIRIASIRLVSLPGGFLFHSDWLVKSGLRKSTSPRRWSLRSDCGVLDKRPADFRINDHTRASCSLPATIVASHKPK